MAFTDLQGGAFSSANIATSVAAVPCVAAITFLPNGRVLKHENGTVTLIAEWDDEAIVQLGHEVRFTNHDGDALANPTAAEDEWHTFADSEFSLPLDNAVGTSTIACTFDVELRLGGGAITDTISISLSAELTA